MYSGSYSLKRDVGKQSAPAPVFDFRPVNNWLFYDWRFGRGWPDTGAAALWVYRWLTDRQ